MNNPRTGVYRTAAVILLMVNAKNWCMKIRPMEQEDLPKVLEIQSACYTEVAPESLTSIDAKRTATPNTCLIAEVDGDVVGYLIALPWRFASPPELDASACTLPANPDCLYLHDLAVAPVARGFGVGKSLVAAFFAALRDLGLARASLIAVQSSAPYWEGIGFRPAALTEPLKEKLASYGPKARYMEYVSSKWLIDGISG